LSLGQKQLVDLLNVIEKDKEVYIFDEAENNLDEDNKKVVVEKLEVLSRKKIVVVVGAEKNIIINDKPHLSHGPKLSDW